MRDESAVDLTNCDREPIHIPGSVQPFGCLLVTDGSATHIERHSLNVPDMLGLDFSNLNECPLEQVLGAKATHEVRNALARSTNAARAGLVLDLELENGRRFDVAAHSHDGKSIIEFEPCQEETGQSPLELSRVLIGRIADISEPDRLAKMTSRLVADLLGYDRVMVYRFAADGSGKVVSETKRADLESFMGQHFPASDIPKQARKLYKQNIIRSISDSRGGRVLIEPQQDSAGQPIDLSFSQLRSVSPIHLEYLRNMGVSASMSISILVGGELWGMIACHHYSPKILPMTRRIAAEMFGEFLSLHLESMLQKKKVDTATRARQTLDGMMRYVPHNADIGTLLSDKIEDFGELIDADGIGLWINDEWTSTGSVPPEDAIPGLAGMVKSVSEAEVWSTHALSQHLSSAADYQKQAAGVIAVPLSQLPHDYLFFFRKEILQTIEWAGNPDKSYETGPLGDRLTPRKSFDIWKQEVRGQAEPWTEEEKEIANAAHGALIEIVLRNAELLTEEREQAEIRQKMLNEELNHRVKNILALIKSIVAQPVDQARSLRDYVDSLKGRIQALAMAHDQVVRGGGGGGLRDLLEAEIAPYREHAGDVNFEGDTANLDGRSFSVMALILHEMATNAAKYGALSTKSGRLDVSWSRTENGDLRINWRESGGPVVQPPNREGFGSVLLNRSVQFDLGGESVVEYPPEGVRAQFLIPARFVTSSAAVPTHVAPRAHAVANEQVKFEGLNVLVVEDQFLIAMNAESMLSEVGAAEVRIGNSTAEALGLLAEWKPDLALLDVNLGEDTSEPIADELSRLGIPFVFATGYGDTQMIPDAMSHIHIVRKPYDTATLSEAMGIALKAGMREPGH